MFTVIRDIHIYINDRSLGRRTVEASCAKITADDHMWYNMAGETEMPTEQVRKRVFSFGTSREHYENFV